MTKQNIIDHLTYNCGLHRASAITAVNGIMDVVTQAIVKGEDVTLRGFGTFKVVTLAEKIGRNINNGTPIIIPAHRAVKLKLCNELKALLNTPPESL